MGWKNKAAVGALALALSTVTIWEGLSHKVYIDPVGIPTVCYGHTGYDVVVGETFTPEACDKLLMQDLHKAVRIVEKNVTVELPDHTKAALISFVYNVGESNFRKSTLLKLLNQNRINAACHELPRWIYAKGKKLNGLVKRRQAEMEMCLGN